MYDKLSDIELTALLKEGDEAAFTEIYNRYWEKMASYAIRLTKSSDEGGRYYSGNVCVFVEQEWR